MTFRPPIDSDLYHIVALHSILALEVTIRHTWLNHRKDLEALRSARARANELAKNISVPDAGELIADVFFEAVELKCSPRHLLHQYTTSLEDEEYDVVSTAMRALWQEQRKEVMQIAAKLPAAERFRLSDLSWQNDLRSLLAWCVFIRTAQPHEIGEQEREDEHGNKYIEFISVAMPARAPRGLRYDNFAIYDAEVDEVSVNGRRIHNASFLMVDTDREINNFDDIVDSFGVHLGSKQAMANWQMLQKGILPMFEALSVYNHNRKLVRQRDNFEVPPRRDRPESMLKGLICWDSHNLEGKTINKACDDVGLVMGYPENRLPDKEYERIRNNYNEVRKQIVAGKLLPWKERTVKNKTKNMTA
jgi:hypothetical protein